MIIVNVEDYFIPDAGYQINIMPKYLAAFGHDVYIVTSKTDGIVKPAAEFFGTDNIEQRDKDFTEKTGVKIIRVKPFTTKLISGRMVQGKELFNTVESLNPDVVYVHGNDTITGIRYTLKKHRKYALVTDSHMLSMATTSRFSSYFQKFYKKFVTPRIIKDNIPVIRTQDDTYVEKFLGIPLSQAPWISYGTDTLLFQKDEEVRKAFREKHNIAENDFVFLYTGKLDEAKGGKLLAQAFSEKLNTEKNIVLVVVGKTSDDDYGKEVDSLLENSQNTVIRFPTQKYTDLPEFYQSADVSVFAKQCSLSFYDAQGCGLPVLSEDNNINVDRNSHNNGLCFKSGDVEDFRAKIEELANMPEDDFKSMSANAYNFITENYNYESKAREYEKVILNAKG